MNRLTTTPDRLGLLDGVAPFVHRGTLDWLAYDVLLNQGEPDYATLLADRRACGANTICFGLRLSWGRNLHAANPGFWQNLIPAARIAADHDLRIFPIVLADTGTDLGDGLHNPAAWQPHIDRLLTDLGAEPNVSYLWANQWDHPTQSRALTPDVLRGFTKPAAFTQPLVALDNPGESGNPIVPAADLACYACSRDTRKFMEIGSSMAYIVNGWPEDLATWAGAHRASLLFEPWRAVPGDPSCDPGLWRQIARSLCFKGVVGGNFYCDQLSKGALTLTGPEHDCAVEFLGNIPTP
jgi:hypothetical protein